MEKLRIEWHRTFDNHSEGFMELNLDAFFPCTVKKANQVFTLVRRWCSEEVIADLERYFLQKVAESSESAKTGTVKKEYSRIHQQLCDNQELVATKKHPNGVPCTYEEWLTAKKQIDVDKQWLKATEQTVKSQKSTAVKWDRMLRLFYAHTSDLHTHTHTHTHTHK